jgi:hypothetical protein
MTGKRTKPLTAAEKLRCGEAANALLGAFEWNQTVEGQKYWSTVYSRLCWMAAGDR